MNHVFGTPQGDIQLPTPTEVSIGRRVLFCALAFLSWSVNDKFAPRCLNFDRGLTPFSIVPQGTNLCMYLYSSLSALPAAGSRYHEEGQWDAAFSWLPLGSAGTGASLGQSGQMISAPLFRQLPSPQRSSPSQQVQPCTQTEVETGAVLSLV